MVVSARSLTLPTDAFLEANDQINTALARFEAFQKGDFAAVASIPTSIASGSGIDGNGTSLIDLDDGSADASNGSASGNTNPVDNLMNLFSQRPPPINTATRPSLVSAPYPTTAQSPPQFGSIMLPGTPTPSDGSANGATGGTTSPPSNFGVGSSSSSLSMGSRIQPQSSAQPQAVPALGPAQFGSMMHPKPQNKFFGSGVGVQASGGPRSSSLGAATPPSGPATPPGLGGFHTQIVGTTAGQRTQTQPTTAQSKDPFADLAGLF